MSEKIREGYEVEWVSDYRPASDTPADELDVDGLVYSHRDFEFQHRAFAFARKVKRTAKVFQHAWVTPFRVEEVEDAPGLKERIYTGERVEF